MPTEDNSDFERLRKEVSQQLYDMSLEIAMIEQCLIKHCGVSQEQFHAAKQEILQESKATVEAVTKKKEPDPTVQ